MSALPVMSDPNLIVGMERLDDAGVYRLTDDLALILTLDFFTPIVDDPIAFGKIAVANALSDVYAMGGKPLLAMNIICFPVNDLDISILQGILQGGADKMLEAGVLLVGGHSVDDRETKYGLSVAGCVHPEKVIRNAGAVPGDGLILTKPIGTGIIATAIKADMADETTIARAVEIMSTLNQKSAERMTRYHVHACTDITGFGLLGHACEMIAGTDVGITISASAVPLIAQALAFARMGIIPGGTYRNEEFRSSMVDHVGVDDDLMKVLFDPQTSGGLLISLPQSEARELLEELHKQGLSDAAIIGEITASPRGRIIVKH